MSDKISEVNKTVSKRLRDLADKAGTTQTQLAKEMGIDRGVFFKDCSGERSVTLERLQKYSKYFNVSTDYLLGLTDIQTPETDIQAVCDYTGLSETAINCFRRVKGPDEDILVDWDADVLVRYIEMLIQKAEHENVLLCDLTDITYGNCLYIERLERLREIKSIYKDFINEKNLTDFESRYKEYSELFRNGNERNDCDNLPMTDEELDEIIDELRYDNELLSDEEITDEQYERYRDANLHLIRNEIESLIRNIEELRYSINGAKYNVSHWLNNFFESFCLSNKSDFTPENLTALENEAMHSDEL